MRSPAITIGLPFHVRTSGSPTSSNRGSLPLPSRRAKWATPPTRFATRPFSTDPARPTKGLADHPMRGGHWASQT